MNSATYIVNNRTINVALRDEADQSVANEIFKLREYRIAEAAISAAKLPIVDVGAHAGFFTLYARALNPTAPIIAIEPERANVAALQRNLITNDTAGVDVIEGALAADYGKRKLALSHDSHNHRLLSHFAVGDELVTVQAYDWAHLLERCPNGIALMKLDIEGGEYEVFGGATGDDLARVHAIIMEYHDLGRQTHRELEIGLREHGFGVQLFPSHFDKTMGFLWATNKRIKLGS